MLYSEKVMDHFEHPRNVGEIMDADAVGQVGNPKCGDIMKMYLKIEDGVIVDAKFKTFGCGSAIATSSMATELIRGKRVEEALSLTNAAVAEALDGWEIGIAARDCRYHPNALFRRKTKPPAIHTNKIQKGEQPHKAAALFLFEPLRQKRR